jgi:hypothetical protein
MDITLPYHAQSEFRWFNLPKSSVAWGQTHEQKCSSQKLCKNRSAYLRSGSAGSGT